MKHFSKLDCFFFFKWNLSSKIFHKELEFRKLEFCSNGTRVPRFFFFFFFGPGQTSRKRIEFKWVGTRVPKTVQLTKMFLPHTMYQNFFSQKLLFGKF